METETLSNYEQKHLDNTMDVDIANNEESVSPVNKTCEESTDIPDKSEAEDNSKMEVESDDCEEEEEEKLLLSPVHSDKAYDSDDPLSPLLNRDLDESDNEEDKIETINNLEDNKNSGEEISDKSEVIISEENKQTEEIRDGETDNSVCDDIDNKQDKNEEISDNIAVDSNKSVGDEETNKVEEINDKDDKEETLAVKDNNEEKLEEKENNKEENQEVEDDKEKNEEEKLEDKDDKEDQEDIPEVTGDKEKNKDGKEDQEATLEVNNDKDEETLEVEKENKEVENSKNQEEKLDDKEGNKENQTDGKKDQEETLDVKDDEEKVDDDDVQIIEEPREILEIEDDDDEEEEKNRIEKETSLLKETLSKPAIDARESEVDEEMDMDEDFDPSLLCPELSMEVDEAPVITTNDAPAPETDGSKSPLRLYDPIFSTFVDEMTGAEVDFDLTTEELELKVKTYGPHNPIQFTKIHCTACNVHLGSALDGQGNRFVHPLLKVLICKKCYHFYTSGEFEKDEDGSELYCRWCGQGGQVMCCSNCEMVFCKKCIRINFDRRKLSDIQKSDEWMCFRCNPSQLIHLRIHCAEFMEYVQNELRRAGSSGNVDAFMNTDYCQCCIPQKKKAPDAAAGTSQPKKKRRFQDEEDPDYDPTKERDVTPVVQPSTSQVTTVKSPVFSPRTGQGVVQPRPNIIRPTTPGISRPRVQVMTPPGVRPQQGFVKVMPGGVRLTSPANASLRAPALRPIRPNSTQKHEWFEKTVRAAARVNSNLSYTLTQLNRAQANAASVEALAVVHNKLQEILSSSINSLIQIRKNLRTEFIAGIKNLRFPPKPQTQTPSSSSSKDDDDVIFIPSDPSPPPPPLVPVTSNNTTINLPSSISLLKKSQSTVSTPPKPLSTSITIKSTGSGGVAKKSTSTVDESSRPKGFLRVKSFSALQNVTSECITIPDDPVEDVIDKSDDKVEEVIEKDPLDVSDVVAEESITSVNGVINGDEEPYKIPTTIDTIKNKDVLGKIKPAKILLQRSSEIDALVKSKFMLMNGN